MPSLCQCFSTYLPVLTNDGAPYVTIGAGNGAVTPSAATNVALGAAGYNFDPALVAQYTAAAGAGLCQHLQFIYFQLIQITL